MVTDTETILVPEAPLIPGLRFRHFRGLDADIPGMRDVVAAANLADGEPEPVTLDGMRAHYAHLERSDPATDVLVVELDERVIGYARVEWGDTNDGERYYEAICEVHPRVRRRGIGRAMLAWTERRRREIAAEHRWAGNGLERPWWLTSGVHDTDLGGVAMLGAAGYEPFRRFHSMIRPNLAEIPELALPDGIEVRPIPPDRDAMRRVFLADGEAFRDHFGWVDDSEDAFLAFAEDPDTDPALWLVAFEGNEIVAGVLNGIHTQDDGGRQGWLDSVFTRRAWRRRGIARALIARSLALMRDQGLDAAYLGVDSQNPNEALTLYESSGFRAVSSASAYRRALEPRP
jgi:mycothiol synthase